MQAVRDYAEAVKLLFKYGHGSVKTVYGSVFEGSPFDLQSPINDPEGIGYLSMKTSGDQVVDIYENEFAELVDIW